MTIFMNSCTPRVSLPPKKTAQSRTVLSQISTSMIVAQTLVGFQLSHLPWDFEVYKTTLNKKIRKFRKPMQSKGFSTIEHCQISSKVEPDHHKHDGGVDSCGIPLPALTSSDETFLAAQLARSRGVWLTGKVETEQSHAVDKRQQTLHNLVSRLHLMLLSGPDFFLVPELNHVGSHSDATVSTNPGCFHGNYRTCWCRRTWDYASLCHWYRVVV